MVLLGADNICQSGTRQGLDTQLSIPSGYCLFSGTQKVFVSTTDIYNSLGLDTSEYQGIEI